MRYRYQRCTACFDNQPNGATPMDINQPGCYYCDWGPFKYRESTKCMCVAAGEPKWCHDIDNYAAIYNQNDCPTSQFYVIGTFSFLLVCVLLGCAYYWFVHRPKAKRLREEQAQPQQETKEEVG